MKNEDNEEIRTVLMEMMGSHWVAVKFHKTKPRGIKLSTAMTFCSAAAHAIVEPVLLKVSAIPCGGAKYAFKVPGAKAPAFGNFVPGRFNTLIDPKSLISGVPRLDFSPAYVSFNLSGHGADLYLSFMMIESANEVAQAWSAITGNKLNCKFTGVMSFCSEGAAGALVSKTPSLSFGCAKAIKAAGMQGQVCVCLPGKTMEIFARAWRKKSVMAAA